MSVSLNSLEIEQLTTLLQQKTALYDQMIKGNKEFGEVKALFLEIKDLVQALTNLQEPNISIIADDLTTEEKARELIPGPNPAHLKTLPS